MDNPYKHLSAKDLARVRTIYDRAVKANRDRPLPPEDTDEIKWALGLIHTSDDVQQQAAHEQARIAIDMIELGRHEPWSNRLSARVTSELAPLIRG